MSDFINHVMCHETKSDDDDGSDNDKRDDVHGNKSLVMLAVRRSNLFGVLYSETINE